MQCLGADKRYLPASRTLRDTFHGGAQRRAVGSNDADRALPTRREWLGRRASPPRPRTASRQPAPAKTHRPRPGARSRSRPAARQSRPPAAARSPPGLSNWRIVPSVKTATRSPNRRASSARCETCTTVVARSLSAASRSSKNARRASASSPAAGSSRSSSRGSIARARARLTRCASPPESERAFRSARPATPMRSRAASATALRARASMPRQRKRKLDVANHAGGEQPRTLRCVADVAPGLDVGVGDWYPVYLDMAGRGRIEPGQEPEQGRLAGAVRTQDRQALARSQVELVDRKHIAAATAVADVARAYDCAHEAARC